MTTNGLRLCMLCDDKGDLRPLLRGEAAYEAIKQQMSEFIYRKPWGHGLPENVIPLQYVMSQIGEGTQGLSVTSLTKVFSVYDPSIRTRCKSNDPEVACVRPGLVVTAPQNPSDFSTRTTAAS